jgi:TonB family protein
VTQPTSGINFRLHRLALAALLCIVPYTTLDASTTPVSPEATRIDLSEQRLARTLARASQFVDVHHTSQEECEQVQAPVELATPDPLYLSTGRDRKVKVSFIIGTDGRVHSPLILVSAGLAGDRHVLDTVRTWRYRPGTCNGVPTETEGKIEFSAR